MLREVHSAGEPGAPRCSAAATGSAAGDAGQVVALRDVLYHVTASLASVQRLLEAMQVDAELRASALDSVLQSVASAGALADAALGERVRGDALTWLAPAALRDACLAARRPR